MIFNSHTNESDAADLLCSPTALLLCPSRTQIISFWGSHSAISPCTLCKLYFNLMNFSLYIFGIAEFQPLSTIAC